MVGSALLRTKPANIEIETATREELSLTDYEGLVRYFRQTEVDSVILAAAKVGGIGANSTQQRSFLVENLNIQNCVLSAAADARVKKLLFLGSSCIYPKMAPQPIKESALLTGVLESTNDGYALAKIAGIRLARAIYEEEKLQYFSLMPSNLYGPNDNFDLLESHVPAALIRKFHEAKESSAEQVVVWGTGKPRREFMHVNDLGRACWYLFEQNVGGELVNVGTGQDVEIGEFAHLIAKVVGYKGEIVYDSTKPDGTPRKLLDVSKVHSYGWKHQIELEEGLRQTYDWFVKALSKGEVRGY